MTENIFWRTIEDVHDRSPTDIETKCRLLEECLLENDPQEIILFDQHFSGHFRRAYTQDLWGAAHIIGNGCGDDKFSDFRGNLISQGRRLFDSALLDADSLADWAVSKDQAFWEGYQYVPSKVYEQVTGRELPVHTRHPAKPSGKAFKEWKMAARYPRLVALHAYQDKAWEYLKPKPDLWNRKFTFLTEEGRPGRKGSLTDLLLAGGIIAASGWIPPLKVTAKALQDGGAPAGSGITCKWAGFELFEGDYWRAIVELERMKPEEIARVPRIKALRLQHDVRFNRSEDFDDWLGSLTERGMLSGG